jgi:hypothetical protein
LQEQKGEQLSLSLCSWALQVFNILDCPCEFAMFIASLHGMMLQTNTAMAIINTSIFTNAKLHHLTDTSLIFLFHPDIQRNSDCDAKNSHLPLQHV